MGVQLDGSMGAGVSRLEVIEGPSGRRRRTKAERARIAAESMMPGVTVADIARKHGTTRWQIYDWRKQIRKGNLVLPESVAALPVFAELAFRAMPVPTGIVGRSGVAAVITLPDMAPKRRSTASLDGSHHAKLLTIHMPETRCTKRRAVAAENIRHLQSAHIAR